MEIFGKNFFPKKVFGKKSRTMPKENPKGGPFVSPVRLEALKNLLFSARIEPTLSGLVEDEQI